MKETGLEGVRVITPEKHTDGRGFFSEVYNRERFTAVGITDDWVQDNHSLSEKAGTVRGLHFQIAPLATAKLIRVVRGALVDVVVDVRHGSPTFGEHVALEISSQGWEQIYVPVGFAHGFCTLEPDTEVVYKVTAHWSPEVDKGVLWNDPALGIDWPVPGSVVVSDKDAAQPLLADTPEYFTYDQESR